MAIALENEDFETLRRIILDYGTFCDNLNVLFDGYPLEPVATVSVDIRGLNHKTRSAILKLAEHINATQSVW